MTSATQTMTYLAAMSSVTETMIFVTETMTRLPCHPKGPVAQSVTTSLSTLAILCLPPAACPTRPPWKAGRPVRLRPPCQRGPRRGLQRFHRLGEQRHAGHGGCQLRPALASELASRDGPSRASKADAFRGHHALQHAKSASSAALRRCSPLPVRTCSDPVVQGLDGSSVLPRRASERRPAALAVTCVPSVTSPLSRTSGMLPVTGPSNIFTYVFADALVQWLRRRPRN